ncbi:RNA polymerase sigma factor [candidate division KSB1 bacterium]|nr:RNA polymerase sigma factor [candidate division KSB1 bacterium]
MTDEQLIQAYKSGDEDAFRTLIKRHEPRVAATVIGMLGNCPEADDVGQETFIRFHNSLDQFRGQASVGTYITRIAINLSLNELKRRRKRQFLFFSKSKDDDEETLVDETGGIEYDDEKEIVRKAIQDLEPDFRAVVVLRMMEGYSTKETADMLNVPLGTVLSRLARAQKKLKAVLMPLLGDS